MSGLQVLRLVFRHGWSLPLSGKNGTSRGRRLEWTTMQARHLLDLFQGHTFDACIGGMSSQWHIGLLEPVVQGLGMNTQHLRTVCYRKSGHDQDSFQGKITCYTRASRFPGTFPELRHFQEMSWKSGKRARWSTQQGGWCESKPGLAGLQTTFRVVITGSASVAATPPGPGQGPFHAPRRKPDEPCEQMAHFRNGQGKRRRSRRRPRGHRRGSGATGEDTNPCKVRKSQQDERDVPVPTNEAANLIVVQSDIFAVFKILLNMPSGANGLDHLWQGGSFRGKDEVVRFLVGISEATANEQPMSSIILPLVQHRNDCPVEEPGAFGAFAHRKPLPIAIREHERFDQRGFFASASSSCLEPNRLIASNRQHVGVPMRFQPGTQVQIATIDRISHDPGNGDLSLPNAFDHLYSQFWLRLEANRFWDAYGSTSITILTPVQGKIEFAVN